MTVALVVALAATVIIVVILAWRARRVDSDLRRERQRVEEAGSRLRSATDAQRQAEAVADEADRRAADAELERSRAERQAVESEMRASEAEQHQSEIRAAMGRSLLAVEHIRLEREWTDLVGPGVAPPTAWNGTVEAALAIELAIIRETMGAPGEINTSAPVSSEDPGRVMLSLRLATELLRLLARDGGEMRVTVGAAEITVQQEAPGGLPSGFDLLAEAAAHGGAALSIAESGGWITARLSLAAPG